MHRWFSEICKKHAERVFVRPSFRYKDLSKLSKDKKQDFLGQNIKKGSRVIVSEYNSVDFLAKLNALWEIGATPCLVSPKLSLSKKEACENLMLHSNPESTTDAMLLLTSGTSANMPKGIRLSHGNLTSHVEMLREHISQEVFSSNDRTFSFLPWTHCYGLMGECFSVLDRGASMSILTPSSQEQFSFPLFFRDLHWCQPTILFVVPYLLEVILKRDLQMRKLISNRKIRRTFWFGGKLRYIVSGGAHLKPEVRKAFWDDFDVEILQGYGCSEMTPMISLQRSFNFLDTSLGELLPNVQVDVRNNEIWVNGPNRFQGYLDETALSFAEFYNTKDMGYVKDGRLYLTGRSSHIVKLSNGKFMNLTEMEKTLMEMIPFCQDVCIWKAADHNFYGVAHIINTPREYEGVFEKTYRCYEQDIRIHLQKTTFLSPMDGTLTLKGEKCRPVIQSLYNNHF